MEAATRYNMSRDKGNEMSRLDNESSSELDETALDSPQGSSSPGSPLSARFTKGSVIGHFIVIDTLGEGAMGVVLRAYDPDLDRKVAIKLLHADSGDGSEQQKQRLLREAQAMARLSHPNVVTVHEVGMVAGRVFIVMEYVRGQTLTKWRKAQKRGWRETVAIFAAAAGGLAAAHRAGLVHRDFKPDNVLLGDDGRVLVTDFGLVSTAGESRDISGDIPVDATSEPLSLTITRAGSVLGTPHYMAPEQFRAKATDARTDQFSFCVALYECLFGHRPFEGETFSELCENTIHGHLNTSPKGACSGRVRKAILRGLATHPEKRHASMEALMAELSESVFRSHRLAIVVAGLVALLAVGSLILFGGVGQEGPVCQRETGLRDEFWGAEHKKATRSAFASTGIKRAIGSAERLISGVDAYTDSWLTMRLSACEATHKTGAQSEQLLDLRIGCLERRRRELSELILNFTNDVDERQVDHAASALRRLTPIDGCADLVALTAPIPPPRDPATAARVEELKVRLDALRGKKAAGRYKAALPQAKAIAADAKAIGYAPVLAEALLLLGQVLQQTSQLDVAKETQYQAIWAAEEGHHDFIRTRAWLEVLWLVGEAERFEEAQTIAGHVRASLARIGNPWYLQSEFLNHYGNAFYRSGKHEQAIDLYRQSLAIREREFGKDHPETAVILNNLSAAERSLGNFETATTLSMRSLKIKQREFGSDHPRVATAMTNLGIALSEGGQLELGIQYFRDALEIKREALGVKNRSYGIGASNLGDSLTDVGGYEEALGHYEAAIAAFEASSPDQPVLAYPLAGKGHCLLHLGRSAEAIAPLQHSLTLRAPNPDSYEATATRFDLAQALWMIGDTTTSRKLIAQVEKVYVRGGEQTAKELAEVRTWAQSRTPGTR